MARQKIKCIPDYFDFNLPLMIRGINPCNQPHIFPERRNVRKWKRAIIGLFMVLCASANALVLAWDSSAGATSYKLYYGPASQNYTQSINCTQTTGAIALQPGTYFFAVSALAGTKEGLKSQEIQVVVDRPVVVTVFVESSTNIPVGLWSLKAMFVQTNTVKETEFFRARLDISR